VAAPGRMPRYDVRNDGVGPYAVFYCDSCNREFRSQPELVATIAKDIGREAVGGLLRRVPLFGGAIANNVTGQDPRYVTSLTPQQVEKAWGQVQDRFRECPTCRRIVCMSDFDEQSGFCTEDSPRRTQIAEAQAEQAGAVLKGFASALGIGETIKQAGSAMKQAQANAARCPKDGTLAPAGTKFCPECGTAMLQPTVDACLKCGKPTMGAKFCPNCGARIEQKLAGACAACGADTKGAKFCPECGAKQG